MKRIRRLYRFFFPPKCECHLGQSEWHVLPRDCPVHGNVALKEKGL